MKGKTPEGSRNNRRRKSPAKQISKQFLKIKDGDGGGLAGQEDVSTTTRL